MPDRLCPVSSLLPSHWTGIPAFHQNEEKLAITAVFLTASGGFSFDSGRMVLYHHGESAPSNLTFYSLTCKTPPCIRALRR
jgi:hypothetical protein